MNEPSYFGLDFGTSNSTFSVYSAGIRWLLPLDNNNELTIPSVIFFNEEDATTYYGRSALDYYLQGYAGRMMRSLKSVLGSSLMNDKTQIGISYMAFSDIIGMFIHHLKTNAEQAAKQEIDTIVLGRPVNFVDHDKQADNNAQNQLEQIAKAQGFKHIAFQYEPIAAALNYEQNITREEIALIIDMGGGTSDFSIIRLSKDNADKHDRSDDILANKGIHIGGTDFDKALNLNEIMPLLGYKTALRQKNLPTPNYLYHDLATWHKINLLYTHKTLQLLKELYSSAVHSHLIKRFIDVIEGRKGHEIAFHAENAKIALSNNDAHLMYLNCIEEKLQLSVTQSAFYEAITDDVEKVITTIHHTVKAAGVPANTIQTLFLTGGSTLVPLIRQRINGLFPSAQIIAGDTFGSVGLGLAVDAKRKFS